MNALRFGSEVKGSQINEKDAAGRWHPLPDVHVGEPSVCISRSAIVAKLLVENQSKESASLIVMPNGGSFPYGGDSPFTLSFADNEVKYTGEVFAPEPPLPMAITLTPRSIVAFEARIDLANWSWQGQPTVGLRWGFHFLQPPSPGGVVRVRLPAR
jgi:hypothetical protein